MNPDQLGQNDAQQGKGMSNDPKWSDAERDRYQAAYNNAKQKQDNEKK